MDTERTPASVRIKSDGEWYSTSIELIDAQGNTIASPGVQKVVVTLEVGEPTRIELTLDKGPVLNMECPVQVGGHTCTTQ